MSESTVVIERSQLFIDLLLSHAPQVDIYQSSAPLMEQLIDNIISDGDVFREEVVRDLKQSLMDHFVDWNEVRLVSNDRLESFFSQLEKGDYKRKALQAVLNKIFSRSGSLDYQFMMDFESDDLEDYLAGIMELQEGTRKRLMLRVFRKAVSPVTTDHEIIFEKADTEFMPGSEEMKVMFSKMETVDLERIHMLLDLMVQEHGGIVTGEFLSPEDFHSKSLDEIVAKLSALPN
jgi:hypothetical protein